VVGVVINVCACHGMRTKWVHDLNISSGEKNKFVCFEDNGVSFFNPSSLYFGNVPFVYHGPK
jgi:hypothetical protein